TLRVINTRSFSVKRKAYGEAVMNPHLSGSIIAYQTTDNSVSYYVRIGIENDRRYIGNRRFRIEIHHSFFANCI
ncbi:MAG: hypothetical protein LZF63_05375, partial [Nitrosomonas sp.]|nr:hypothetical protein [Nitrosomonas sp.]